MPGVIDTLRIVYEVDVKDHGTGKLVASQRDVAKETKRTSAVIAQQDAQARRSATSATQSSARKTAGYSRSARAAREATAATHRDTVALRQNAAATTRVTAAQQRASRRATRATRGPGIVRGRGAGIARRGVGAVASLAPAAGIGAIAVLGKQAVSTASDISESLTKNEQLFGRWAATIDKASRSSAASFGISRRSFLEYTGVFGNLARAQGISDKASSGMSTNLTRLAADLASFNNTSIDDALEALRSGLVGETEPMRKFGVALSATAVQTEAARTGLLKVDKSSADYQTRIVNLQKAEAARAQALREHGSDSLQTRDATAKLSKAQEQLAKTVSGASAKLTPQQKILATQSLIFRQTDKAQGDFSRTSKGLANQQRILRASWEDATGELGDRLLPTMTRGVRGVNAFLGEMRSGTGAGGRFAAQMRTVGKDLQPVGRALKTAGGLLAEHPRLVLGAAGAYAAFRTARGAVKIVSDMRELGGSIKAARRAAAESRIAKSLAAGASGAGQKIRRALAGVKGVITSLMSRTGRSGGSAAADSIASSAGGAVNAQMTAHSGKFRAAGRASGRVLGRAMGVAAAAAIAVAIGNAIVALTDKIGLLGGAAGRKSRGNWIDKHIPGMSALRALGQRAGLEPKRRGGIVRRYQHGGLVPIVASGGEMLVDGGRASMIGGPSDRDGTPMLARAGSAILTGHGQALMAAGATVAEAVRAQAPHFAKGGVVPGKYTSTSYGPPWGGIQGTGVTRTGVNLKGNPRIYGIATDPRMIALGSKVFAYPNPFGYTGRFSAFDTGGAIKGRRVDFYDWRGRKRQNGWGRRQVTISRARIAPRQDGEDTFRAPGGGGNETTVGIYGRARRRAGLLGDAFDQGRSAGQAGLTNSAIRREGNPVLAAIKEAIAGAGTQPDKGGAASRFKVETGSVGNFPAGSRMAKMTAKASAIDARHYQYSWGGGHGRIGVPTVGTRTPRGGKRGLGYDCSGAVSAVLAAGGLLRSPLTSGGLMGWGRKGSTKKLAVHADPGHTIMRLGSRYWGTGEANPNGGAGWLPRNTMKGRGAVRTYRRGGMVGPGRALNAGLSRVNTFAGGSLDALDGIIQRAAEQRLVALRRQVQARVNRGGAKRVVDRLRGVLDLIDGELGRRVGRIEDVVARRTTRIDRGRGVAERVLRARGVNTDSSAGVGAMGALQAAETGVRAQNVASLQKALQTAGRAKNRNAVREITQQLHDAQDELQESMVRQIELARDAIRAAGQEAVNAAQFRLSLSQTGASGLEAAQRLGRTQDTPEGMAQRAGYQQGVVVTALQAAAQAAQYQAQLAASIGDLDGWRQAVQDAQSSAVDLANAQADAADLMRESVRALGTQQVSAAQFALSWYQGTMSSLDAAQRRDQTQDTPGGMRHRAQWLEQGVIPALAQSVAAAQSNVDLLFSIGDLEGWRAAVLDAQSAVTDLANAQADAADLMREAAAKVVQDQVDATAHGTTMSDLRLQRLEVEQRLAGTYESGGGAQARADLIRQQIVPALDAEILAFTAQQMEAQRQGNTDLVRQLQEAIFAKQTDLLQKNLDANEETAANTDLLKEFGGSTAFSYRDTPFLDNSLDVIRARIGS